MSETSRHLVDPELLDLLDKHPAWCLSTENLQQWRNSSPIAAMRSATSSDDGIEQTVHSVAAAGGAPDIELRVYRQRDLATSAGCILHIHGGGFLRGAAASLEPADRNLSSELKCVVASVDYRLAPETGYPGNLQDCYDALRWLFSRADELGIDRERIGVMGESAGGGLAAALTLLVRDRGELRLAFQHLHSPMLDDRTCVSEDPNPYAGEFVWTRQNNLFGWSSLLGRAPGSDGVSPYAAPARAATLEGLPTAFISIGALDLFVDENLRYVQRLLHAGVPTELHVHAGCFHGFDQLRPTARVSQLDRSLSRAALTRFLTRR
jgi:triacylglycerol lipase